jgi:hypothetical protein
MEKYNYMEAMTEDIRDYINENIDMSTIEDIDELEEQLNAELWTEDSVTGNGSGSYTFNAWKAREYVLDNVDLLREACEELCNGDATIGEKVLNGAWEYMDVTIRCYILPRAISEALVGFTVDIPF